MNQEYRPINHSGLSATATTAAGAAGGAVKSGLLTAITWLSGAALLGATIVGVLTAPAGGFLATLGMIASSPLFWGGAIGLGIGAATLFVPVVLGAAFGAFRGGSRAMERVGDEQAAAYAMQQQLEAYKANAVALASQPVYKLQPGEFAEKCERHMRTGHGQHAGHTDKVMADRVAAQAAAAQPQQQVQG